VVDDCVQGAREVTVDHICSFAQVWDFVTGAGWYSVRGLRWYCDSRGSEEPAAWDWVAPVKLNRYSHVLTSADSQLPLWEVDDSPMWFEEFVPEQQ
jgi:hypothetical protein